MTGRTLAVALAALAYFLAVQFRPSRDVDVFWQVALGELTLDTGRLVFADPFSSTHANEPVPTISWLAQIGYALVLRAEPSWALLHRLDAALFAFALGLAAWRGSRAAWFPTVLAFGLAAQLALPNQGLRPQTFAAAGFALLVVLERAGPGGWRGPAAAFAVGVVWQNLHPSLSVGMLYLGLRLAGAAVTAWRTRDFAPVRRLAGLLVAATAATVCTPDGAGVYSLSRANAAISKDLRISEWLPVWDPGVREAAPGAWLALAVTAGLLVAVNRRADAGDVLVAVGFGAATALVYRLSLFWAVAAVPVWAGWIAQARPAWADPGPPRVRGGRRLAALALALAVAVPLSAGAKTFHPELPFAGLAALKREGVTGTVYNYREWGGPLIWAGRPGVRVVIDGRLYFYPRPDWAEYARVAGGEVPLSAVVARHDPAAFFLRPTYHVPLIAELAADPGWRLAHADAVCTVYVRAGP